MMQVKSNLRHLLPRVGSEKFISGTSYLKWVERSLFPVPPVLSGQERLYKPSKTPLTYCEQVVVVIIVIFWIQMGREHTLDYDFEFEFEFHCI